MKKLLVAALLLSVSRLAAPAAAGQNQSRQETAHQAAPTTEKAEALLGAGRVDEAINTLKAIPRTSSNESLINHLLGLAHYQKSDYAAAVEFLVLSARTSPDSSKQHRQAIRLLGMSHY